MDEFKRAVEEAVAKADDTGGVFTIHKNKIRKLYLLDHNNQQEALEFVTNGLRDAVCEMNLQKARSYLLIEVALKSSSKIKGAN